MLQRIVEPTEFQEIAKAFDGEVFVFCKQWLLFEFI
jgi:hypothetical protein